MSSPPGWLTSCSRPPPAGGNTSGPAKPVSRCSTKNPGAASLGRHATQRATRRVTMKSGLSFLVGALRCEIDALEQLARTSELVATIARLVHALQRERGISNVFLASGGRRFASQREEQIADCLGREDAVRLAFDQLDAEGGRVGNGARLFSRIAWVLPGLDALPALRQRIGAMELDAGRSTAAFVKL